MDRLENKKGKIRMMEEEEEVMDKKNEASNFMDEIPDVSADKIQNDEDFTVKLVDKQYAYKIVQAHREEKVPFRCQFKQQQVCSEDFGFLSMDSRVKTWQT